SRSRQCPPRRRGRSPGMRRLSSCVLAALLAVAASATRAEEPAPPAPGTPQEVVPSDPAENALGEPDASVSLADRAFGAYQRGYYLTAFELAISAAEQGSAASQTLLGQLYEK